MTRIDFFKKLFKIGAGATALAVMPWKWPEKQENAKWKIQYRVGFLDDRHHMTATEVAIYDRDRYRIIANQEKFQQLVEQAKKLGTAAAEQQERLTQIALLMP